MAAVHARRVARLSLLVVASVLAACTALLGSTALAASHRPPAHRAPAPPAHLGPGGWTHPFAFAGPFANDLLAPQIALARSGDAAVAFGVFSEDFPWQSQALITTRSAGGQIGRTRHVPNAKQVLSLAYEGSSLELLTATGPGFLTCCSAARAVTLAGGKFGHPRTLVTGLGGAALGGLVGLPGSRLLAAVATAAGVWVAQSPAVGRFRPGRRLTTASSAPKGFGVAALSHGRSAVAWAETVGETANAPAGEVFLATGTAQQAPGSGRLVLSAPAGHAIDELGLAGGGSSGPTLAWTESWYDRAGNYHSEAAVADAAAGALARRFAFAGQLASGLTFVSDAKGDEVLAWKTCDGLASCSVRAASRAAGRRFGAPQRVGSIDVNAVPAAAVAPNGDALLVWITRGHVMVAGRRGGGSRFGGALTLSGARDASDPAVAFGAGGQALVAWTQGIAKPLLMGAFRG